MTTTTPAATTATPRHRYGKPASDNDTLIDWGQRLAARRRELGIIQKDLADHAGISRTTLHTLEHGGAGIRWEKVLTIANLLGMSIHLNEPTTN